MIRESLDADARHFSLYVSGYQGLTNQWRTVAGERTFSRKNDPAELNEKPIWIQISKIDDVLSVAYKFDGDAGWTTPVKPNGKLWKTPEGFTQLHPLLVEFLCWYCRQFRNVTAAIVATVAETTTTSNEHSPLSGAAIYHHGLGMSTTTVSATTIPTWMNNNANSGKTAGCKITTLNSMGSPISTLVVVAVRYKVILSSILYGASREARGLVPPLKGPEFPPSPAPPTNGGTGGSVVVDDVVGKPLPEALLLGQEIIG